MITLFWISLLATIISWIVFGVSRYRCLDTLNTFSLCCALFFGFSVCGLANAISVKRDLARIRDKKELIAEKPEAAHSCPFCGNSFEIKFTGK